MGVFPLISFFFGFTSYPDLAQQQLLSNSAPFIITFAFGFWIGAESYKNFGFAMTIFNALIVSTIAGIATILFTDPPDKQFGDILDLYDFGILTNNDNQRSVHEPCDIDVHWKHLRRDGQCRGYLFAAQHQLPQRRARNNRQAHGIHPSFLEPNLPIPGSPSVLRNTL